MCEINICIVCSECRVILHVSRDLRSLCNKRLTSKLLAPSSMLTQYGVGSKFNTGIHSWLVVRIVRVSARGGLEKWSRGRKRFLASDWTLSNTEAANAASA